MSKDYKWRKIYAVAIGAVGYYLILCIVSILAQLFISESADTEVAILSIALVAFSVLYIIGVHFFNNYMMKRTGTNAILLSQFRSGAYNYLIPDKLYNEKNIKVLDKYIRQGYVTTMTNAVRLLKVRSVCIKVSKVAFFLVYLLSLPFFKLLEDIGENFCDLAGDCANSVENSVANAFSSAPAQKPAVNPVWEKTKARNKAVFMETRAKNTCMQAPGSYAAQKDVYLARQQRYNAEHM